MISTGTPVVGGDAEEGRGTTVLIGAMAAVALGVHVVVNLVGGYGYARDELYYLACSEHLGAGYVDHPPLSIFALALFRRLFGDSLFAIRLAAGLAGAACVALTGLLARELGGGRKGVLFACLAVLVSPIHLGLSNIYSMNAFDIVVWPAAALVLARLAKTGKERGWLLLGVLLGLGLLNKVSVLWLAAGVGVATVLVGSLRRQLRGPWPYVGAAVALLLFSPYAVWNALHGFPHLEFMRNALSGKYSGLTPASFLVGAVLLHHPLALPLWLGGAVFLLAGRSGDPEERSGRLAVGIAFATALAVLLVNYHSKPEYLAPAMALAFAGGGLALERGSASWKGWVAPVYTTMLVVVGLAVAPYVLPILPVPTYVAYTRLLGLAPPSPEGHRLEELPQHWADMFGWEEKVRGVAAVYSALDAADREKAAIFADNYGRCGAVDFFGRRYGLPKSIGGHNSYWLWGPRGYTGEVVIVLGGDTGTLKELFESVEIAGTTSCEYCIPYERDLPIHVCRRSRHPLPELWRLAKNFG
jgi:hypothetical protein